MDEKEIEARQRKKRRKETLFFLSRIAISTRKFGHKIYVLPGVCIFNMGMEKEGISVCVQQTFFN